MPVDDAAAPGRVGVRILAPRVGTTTLGARQRGVGELANLLRLADALLDAALARTESRGSHARREYPDTDPAWRRRIVHGHVAARNGA